MADTTRAIDPADVTFSRRWAKMTKLLQHRIGINGSFFNTPGCPLSIRNAYFPPSVIETAEPPVPQRRASDKSAKPTLA
jgi:hypothetical protein